MSDNSFVPRVNELEREMHTIRHRVTVIEDTHKDTPHRLTRLEIAIDELPEIKRAIAQQGVMIRNGFSVTQGALFAIGGIWTLWQIGPEVLKFLGAK